MKKRWKILAVLFALINVGGVLYALRFGEWLHLLAHAGLLGAGFLAWQLVASRSAEAQRSLPEPGEIQRLDSLQNAVDSIALNVERIGEAQRYQENLLKERTRGGGA